MWGRHDDDRLPSYRQLYRAVAGISWAALVVGGRLPLGPERKGVLQAAYRCVEPAGQPARRLGPSDDVNAVEGIGGDGVGA